MTRLGRLTQTVLAAAATLAAALPLLDLFTPATWTAPLVAVVLAVAATGLVVRNVTRATGAHTPIALAQLLVAVLVLGVQHLRQDLFYGLPGPDAIHRAGTLLAEAADTVTRYSAPAPATKGISFAIGIVMALLAIAVDHLSVGRSAPALAGIPLGAAFLAAATNSATPVPWPMFAILALLWLALLAHTTIARVRRWGTLGPAPTVSGGGSSGLDPGHGLAAVGRIVAVAAVAAALLSGATLPHFPTTFLANGLGRHDGVGRGPTVSLADAIDIRRNLADRSTNPVLVYETNDPTPVPLRVGVSTDYGGGRWNAAPGEGFKPVDGALPPVAASPEVARKAFRISVSQNNIASPELASPDLPTGISLPPEDWALGSFGLLQAARQVEEYDLDYVELDPTSAQFGPRTDPFRPDAVSPGALQEEPGLNEVADSIVSDDATPVEKARAIQAYLRSSAFIYSTEVEDNPDGTPVMSFLTAKRGYCVQFSTAMVFLATAKGIPSRLAIGYLPGAVKDKQRVVVAADAHAWPELYFDSIGWVRFEPTPGVRTGIAPGYTQPTASPSSTPTSSSTGSRSPTRNRLDRESVAPTGQGQSTGPLAGIARFIGDHAELIAGLLVLLLAAGALPLSASLARRLALRRARTDAERAEAQWRSLMARLDDVGVGPPAGATPREAASHVIDRVRMEQGPRVAMGRMVETIERGRYAAPGALVPDAADDVREVVRGVRATRSVPTRFRALAIPREGRAVWGRFGDYLDTLPRRLWARASRRR